MHPRDALLRPGLYKVNGLSMEQMSANLICLTKDCASSEDITPDVFLSEEDVIDAIKDSALSRTTNADVPETERNQKFGFQQPVAVVWDGAGRKRWYVGFVVSEQADSSVTVDHLERKSESCDSTRQRPPTDDTQTTDIVQILPCPVEGEWNFSSRIPTLM